MTVAFGRDQDYKRGRVFCSFFTWWWQDSALDENSCPLFGAYCKTGLPLWVPSQREAGKKKIFNLIVTRSKSKGTAILKQLVKRMG